MSYYNEARYKASKKYKESNIKRVPLDMKVSDYEQLKAEAERVGVKVNTYIKQAIAAKMEDGEKGTVSTGGNSGFSGQDLEEIIYSRLFPPAASSFKSSLAASGQTLEDYIVQSILERLEREKCSQ